MPDDRTALDFRGRAAPAGAARIEVAADEDSPRGMRYAGLEDVPVRQPWPTGVCCMIIAASSGGLWTMAVAGGLWALHGLQQFAALMA